MLGGCRSAQKIEKVTLFGSWCRLICMFGMLKSIPLSIAHQCVLIPRFQLKHPEKTNKIGCLKDESQRRCKFFSPSTAWHLLVLRENRLMNCHMRTHSHIQCMLNAILLALPPMRALCNNPLIHGRADTISLCADCHHHPDHHPVTDPT